MVAPAGNAGNVADAIILGLPATVVGIVLVPITAG